MNLARFAWRQVWKGAAVWSAVIAVVIMSGVNIFEAAYTTEASRQALVASMGKMPSLQALYGRAAGVGTTGGFVAWRYGDIMTVVVGLWALLTVSRMLRGDEENLRAEVLLAGRVSPRRLTLTQLAMLIAGAALIWAVIALTCVASGLPAGGAALFGLMVVGGGMVFGAVAAVTSQLFDTRRRAAGWAGAVLGASYLLRALADGSGRMRWLVWASPLGWAERIEPFGEGAWVPVVAVVGATATLVAAAVVLRGRRDTGAGLIAEREGRAGSRSIGSALALDWFLSTTTLIAWGIGVTIELFVLGYLTNDVLTFSRDNANIDEMVVKMFGYSMNSAVGFLSVSFTVVAMMLGVYAGTQMLRARDEEAAGRAANMLVAGTSRTRWLGARVAVGLAAMLLLALLAAIGAWAGANASGASVGLSDALRSSANVVPAALLFGGLAVLTFGLRPRATAWVAFGGVTLAYTVQMVAGLASAPSWMINLSPFSHIAPVPARPANVGAMLVMLVIAGGSTLLGLVAFHRRDIVGE